MARRGSVAAASGEKFVTATGVTGTSQGRYMGTTVAGPPASGTFQVGDFVNTQDGRFYVCTTAGTPGTWRDGSAVFGFPSTVQSFANVSATAQVWTSANRAYWWRVREGGVISSLGLYVGVSSGNISVSVNAGVLGRNGPGASRAVSGAVACPATGDQTVSLGSTVTVYPGDWIGMSCDNTTATFRSIAPGLGIEAWMLGLMAYKDSAHPIAAGTPSSPSYRGDKLVVLYGV
jgi:hypothetical protein